MLKLSTIEDLRNSNIITLVECDESEFTADNNVVLDNTNKKYYKIQQTEEEIKIEILTACYKSLKTIKLILIAFSIIVFFILFF